MNRDKKKNEVKSKLLKNHQIQITPIDKNQIGLPIYPIQKSHLVSNNNSQKKTKSKNKIIYKRNDRSHIRKLVSMDKINFNLKLKLNSVKTEHNGSQKCQKIRSIIVEKRCSKINRNSFNNNKDIITKKRNCCSSHCLNKIRSNFSSEQSFISKRKNTNDLTSNNNTNSNVNDNFYEYYDSLNNENGDEKEIDYFFKMKHNKVKEKNLMNKKIRVNIYDYDENDKSDNIKITSQKIKAKSKNKTKIYA